MARSRSSRPTIKPTEFESIEKIDKGIRKFQRLIQRVRALDPQTIMCDDQRVRSLEDDIHNAFLEVFGQLSPMFQSNQYPRIRHGPMSTGDTFYDRQKKFAAGIPQTVKLIAGIVSHLEDKKVDFEPPMPEPQPAHRREPPQISIQGNVGRFAIGDFNEQNFSAVILLSSMAHAIEKSDNIPEAEKKSLLDRIRGLVSNRFIIDLSSKAIIEVLKKGLE